MVEPGKRKAEIKQQSVRAKPVDEELPQIWNCERENGRALDELRFSQYETLAFEEMILADPKKQI